MEKNILNRKIYKDVKKMDRQEMEMFMMDLYRKGFEDGTEVGNMADFKIQLMKVLENTKGIGPSLTLKIFDTVKEMGL